MKLERRRITIETPEENIRIYLAEAKSALRHPGLFPEIVYNPVLLHAAFAAVCAAYKLFDKTIACGALHLFLKPTKFLVEHENGDSTFTMNCRAILTIVDSFFMTGQHSANLWRNRGSLDDAIELGVVLEKSSLLLLELIDEMLEALDNMVDKKGEM